MKKVTYRERPGVKPETTPNPIPVPMINHASRDGWKNEAVEAYEEIYGKPLSEAPNDLAIPFPDNSFGERFKFGLKTTLLKVMFSLLSFFTKERGTHHNGGVGAKGSIKFLDNTASKKLSFCDETGELPVTIRHSNASFEDDGCSQLRAMAIRIERGDQVEDFLLSTGAIIPFWSINSLMNFAKYRGKVKDDNWEPQKEWLRESPTAFVAAMEAVRLAPESYAKMSYYSAIPYGIEGSKEYVKFRVMPVDMDKESGLLTSHQQRQIWMQNRIDNNDRPEQYLADEYKKRLNQGAIKYVLEVQVRILDEETDTSEFFNLARYWDDTKYPWEPIAELNIETKLDDAETERLAYWLGNMPKGMDFVDTYSAEDYNSVAKGRIKIYPTPQKLRKKK